MVWGVVVGGGVVWGGMVPGGVWSRGDGVWSQGGVVPVGGCTM